MMKPPILVFESHDLAVYSSAEQAASHLEKVDVEDGIYEAYDSDGLLLDIQVKQREVQRALLWRRWKEQEDVITVVEHVPKADDLEEVRRRLMRYDASMRSGARDLEALSMNALIRLACRRMPWKVEFPEDEDAAHEGADSP